MPEVVGQDSEQDGLGGSPQRVDEPVHSGWNETQFKEHFIQAWYEAGKPSIAEVKRTISLFDHYPLTIMAYVNNRAQMVLSAFLMSGGENLFPPNAMSDQNLENLIYEQIAREEHAKRISGFTNLVRFEWKGIRPTQEDTNQIMAEVMNFRSLRSMFKTPEAVYSVEIEVSKATREGEEYTIHVIVGKHAGKGGKVGSFYHTYERENSGEPMEFTRT
jgi:hypothetical protein